MSIVLGYKEEKQCVVCCIFKIFICLEKAPTINSIKWLSVLYRIN